MSRQSDLSEYGGYSVPNPTMESPNSPKLSGAAMVLFVILTLIQVRLVVEAVRGVDVSTIKGLGVFSRRNKLQRKESDDNGALAHPQRDTGQSNL